MMFGNTDKAVEAQSLNRATLLQALTALSITHVTISYNGYGDSGDVSQVEPTPPTAKPQLTTYQMPYVHVASSYQEGQWHSRLESRMQSLDESLRDFALNWVELHHGGWENNEGGDGEVSIDVAGNAFTLDHNACYTERDHYGYTL